MRTRIKLLAAVLCGGMAFNAAGQIYLDGGYIQFRRDDNAINSTIHYGDFYVNGGTTNGFYGWLNASRLVVNGNSSYTSSMNHDLNLFADLNVFGSKNFIHPHPTDSAKVIRYIATESGEALTLAQGSAKTVNGEATIRLPEHFSLVTSKDAPIRVIVTPKGAPVLLYVKEESKDKIVIAMKKSDFTEFRDVEFAYQVTGVRDGFVGQEVVIDAEKLDKSGMKLENDVQKRIAAHAQRSQKRIEKQLEEKKNGHVKE